MITTICIVGADGGKSLVEKSWLQRPSPNWIADEFFDAVRVYQATAGSTGVAPPSPSAILSPNRAAGAPEDTGIPSPAVTLRLPGSTDVVTPSELPPVLVSGRGTHVHQLWDGKARLWWLAACQDEVAPLSAIHVLRFLQQLTSEYYGMSVNGFSVLSEQLIRDNAAGILQILEEALDDGRPVWTDEAVIRDLVPPPSLLSNIVQALGGPVSFANPGSQQASPAMPLVSNLPWRGANTRHLNNELFLDVVEDLDVIIDAKTGGVVVGEVRGAIQCDCRLSGMPDIVLTIHESALRHIDAEMVSLHPSVRLSRWQRDKVLSFIPPDGAFTLCTYSLPLPASASLPIHVRPSLTVRKNRGKFELNVQPPRGITAPVENLIMLATLPASAQDVKVETTAGKAVWDVLGKRLQWSLGKLSRDAIDKMGLPVLVATFATSDDDPTAMTTTSHSVHAEFRVQGWCPSGIKVDSLQVLNETGYKAYKGVRFLTRSGRYCTR